MIRANTTATLKVKDHTEAGLIVNIRGYLIARFKTGHSTVEENFTANLYVVFFELVDKLKLEVVIFLVKQKHLQQNLTPTSVPRSFPGQK